MRNSQIHRKDLIFMVRNVEQEIYNSFIIITSTEVLTWLRNQAIYFLYEGIYVG
jgi:hypothetical protein